MLVQKILVVCVGNICRSPVAERLLQKAVPTLEVRSAGLGALVGMPADQTANDIAVAHGISLGGHVAQQFTERLGSHFDLILVMEPGHRREVARIAPQLSGRVMLFDQWTGRQGIADPYKRSREFHELTFEQIREASKAWAERLSVVTGE